MGLVLVACVSPNLVCCFFALVSGGAALSAFQRLLANWPVH